MLDTLARLITATFKFKPELKDDRQASYQNRRNRASKQTPAGRESYPAYIICGATVLIPYNMCVSGQRIISFRHTENGWLASQLAISPAICSEGPCFDVNNPIVRMYGGGDGDTSGNPSRGFITDGQPRRTIGLQRDTGDKSAKVPSPLVTERSISTASTPTFVDAPVDSLRKQESPQSVSKHEARVTIDRSSMGFLAAKQHLESRMGII
jgi:hypothetical protein